MINLNGMDTEKLELMDSYFDDRVDFYDEIHSQSNISWGIQIRNIVANYLPQNTKTILDLGCGTGLELEKILQKYPNAKVVCVDLSNGMLTKLKEKYPQDNIVIVNKNFFEFDYEDSKYDAVISVMALHHFLESEKIKLYKKIYNCLKENGVFINSDYIINDSNLEKVNFEEYLKIREKYPNELFHFDIPFTENRELEVLNNSGFNNIQKVYENKKTKVLVSTKK